MSSCSVCHGMGYLGPSQSGIPGGADCDACGGTGQVGGGMSFGGGASKGGGWILTIILVFVIYKCAQGDSEQRMYPTNPPAEFHTTQPKDPSGRIEILVQKQSGLSNRINSTEFKANVNSTINFLNRYSDTGREVASNLQTLFNIVQGKTLMLVQQDLGLEGATLSLEDKKAIANLLTQLWGHHRQFQGESGLLNDLHRELGMAYFSQSSFEMIKHNERVDLSEEENKEKTAFVTQHAPIIHDLTLGVVAAMNYRRLLNIVDRSLANPGANNFGEVFDHPDYGAVNNYVDSLLAFDKDLAQREVCEIAKFAAIEKSLPQIVRQAGGEGTWKTLPLRIKREKLGSYLIQRIPGECRE